MHRFIEFDGVEHFNAVTVVPEKISALWKGCSFRIGQKVACIKLHEIRFYIVTGLARAGPADNHDIEVSVMFEVELRFFQGKAIIFREEKIVGRIRLILEGDSFFKGAPFRRPGFLSIAIVTGIHECVEPDDKNRNGESDCIQHGNRCHRDSGRRRDDRIDRRERPVGNLHGVEIKDLSKPIAEVEGKNGQH